MSSLNPLADPRHEPPFKWFPTASTISSILTRVLLDISWSHARSSSFRSCCVCPAVEQRSLAVFHLCSKLSFHDSDEVKKKSTSNLWCYSHKGKTFVMLWSRDTPVPMLHHTGAWIRKPLSISPAEGCLEVPDSTWQTQMSLKSSWSSLAVCSSSQKTRVWVTFTCYITSLFWIATIENCKNLKDVNLRIVLNN